MIRDQYIRTVEKTIVLYVQQGFSFKSISWQHIHVSGFFGCVSICRMRIACWLVCGFQIFMFPKWGAHAWAEAGASRRALKLLPAACQAEPPPAVRQQAEAPQRMLGFRSQCQETTEDLALGSVSKIPRGEKNYADHILTNIYLS